MTLHSIWDGKTWTICDILGGGGGSTSSGIAPVIFPSIVRWVFADHQMMSASMGWRYRQHRLWKIHLRYISCGVPCHDILDALEETFRDGGCVAKTIGICCSMASGRGQSHRQYRQWKKHLEMGVVSQLPGLPGRLALGECRSRWGSQYRWWLKGSPPMYPPLLTPWTWRRSWLVSCRAAPLQRNIDETKRTSLTSSVMPGTILLASDRYSILASGRLPGMFVTFALEGRN